jgi:D-alanyl-lipoteichoic acid acyltransferase DltB (MBOAT superfamily)
MCTRFGLQDLFVDPGHAEYYFVVASAWNYARCISFCFDCLDRTASDISILNFMSYCLYFPLATSGPIILYAKYEEEVSVKFEDYQVFP